MPLFDVEETVEAPPAKPAIWLEDVSARLGTGKARTVGVSLADIVQDGWPDVTLADLGGLKIYKNQQGSLVPQTQALRLHALPTWSGWGIVWVDIDDDGHLDAYVSRAEDRDTVLLYRDGQYIDATAQWGIPEAPTASQGASFADLDGDGDLDLYLAIGTGTGSTGAFGTNGGPNLLYWNQGDHFTEGAAAAGASGLPGGESFGSVLFDMDGDHDIDIFTVNDFARDNVLLNDNGTFTDAVGT